MTSSMIEIEMPAGWEAPQLPAAVNRRLHQLLDQQDAGHALTAEEQEEAQGLVELAEWLSLMRLRSQQKSEKAA